MKVNGFVSSLFSRNRDIVNSFSSRLGRPAKFLDGDAEASSIAGPGNSRIAERFSLAAAAQRPWRKDLTRFCGERGPAIAAACREYGRGGGADESLRDVAGKSLRQPATVVGAEDNLMAIGVPRIGAVLTEHNPLRRTIRE
jgi:hypothetical protein